MAADQSQTPDLTALADKPLPVALLILFAVLFLASIPYWGPPLKEYWSARVKRRAESAAAHAATAKLPAVAPTLPAAVDSGSDFAKRYMDSLEKRAEAAEAHVERLQDRLDQAEKAYYEERARLEAQINSLQSQVNALIYGRGERWTQ